MQGSGGPVKAGSIMSQVGYGTNAAPYTGLPGQTDSVSNPFTIPEADRDQQDFSDARRKRYERLLQMGGPGYGMEME